jgi:hypothetical protein
MATPRATELTPARRVITDGVPVPLDVARKRLKRGIADATRIRRTTPLAEEKQNQELLDLSRQILSVTKAIQAKTMT